MQWQCLTDLGDLNTGTGTAMYRRVADHKAHDSFVMSLNTIKKYASKQITLENM